MTLMQRFIRKLSLYSRQYSDKRSYLLDDAGLEELLVKVKGLIAQPYGQFILIGYSDFFQPLLNEIECSLYELDCNVSEFVQLMKSAKFLRVKHLEVTIIDENRDCYKELDNYLSTNIDCQFFSLHFQRNNSYSLSSHAMSFMNVSSFVSRLQQLTLDGCSITNVSMLGSIPYLALKECYNLVDISALNNNDHIVIERCALIRDYSQSFANSRKIEIFLLRNFLVTLIVFDLARWKKVTMLTLFHNYGTLDNTKLIFRNQLKQLPFTITTCHLGGMFISAIDFIVTSYHTLNELKLSNHDSMASLEGYGLERVAIIECDWLSALQSLQGLGRGRNRKITIRNCDKITDFSPINHIPIVKILYCDGFIDPLQVRFVRDLTIILSGQNQISFRSDIISINPYEFIYSLTLSRGDLLEGFDGLEKVSNLQLGFFSCCCVEDGMKTSQERENQRIVLVLESHNDDSASQDLLSNLHNVYMKDHYDLFDDLPNKWIWTRKSK